MSGVEKDPYRYFRIEAREIVDALSQGILSLETKEGSARRTAVADLMRGCHTLKGAAGVVGQETIATLAHRLEELLTSHGRPEDAPPRERTDAFLALVDAVTVELDVLGAPPAPPPAPGMPAKQESVSQEGTRQDGSRQVAESIRLDLLEVDTLLASISDVSARLASSRVGRRGLSRIEIGLRQVERWLTEASVSADPSVLDWAETIDTVEKLRVELRADREKLEAILEGAERRSVETLEDARRLRLRPAETLFGELARAARDAAMAKQGTPPGGGEDSSIQVEVETTGGDIRVDAKVLGLLRDALLQLVRNAIAHALEPVGERRRAGKGETGKIAISFELRGSRALVKCRDDGRGIDVEALRSAIVAKGLVPAAEASAMDAAALVRVTMRSAVSTRSSATELAGRGVGMQVVGTAIDRLRGDIRVRTERGRGTEFELEVPITVAAAPALVVAAGEVVVTIPLDAVTRTARIGSDAIASSPRGDAISDGGEAIRFASLSRVLRLGAATEPRTSWTAVLLEASGARAAIGVDRIVGVSNEVVLSLPSSAVADPVVVGASLDGEGEPRLALDPGRLVEAVRSVSGAPKAASAAAKRSVLVVDDSLTSRMLERSILEAAGYEVMTATSGEEALEIARGRTFALFVVDVDMPGMGGLEFVARTRRDPFLAVTPAVLVTSRATPEDRRRGQEAGARAYIVKGEFAQDQFLDAVRRLIG